ncbi:DUF3352 domain-containing protein [Myxococcota bacterium]|nr:DUF3352 domain-containing protein [Myxococcota bacterium]
MRRTFFPFAAIFALYWAVALSPAQAAPVSPALRELLLHFPANVEVVAWVPVLGRLPNQLGRLLTKLESKNPMGAQVRAYLEQLKSQHQIDVLSAASLEKLGFVRNGAGVMTLLDIQGTEWVVVAGTAQNEAGFEEAVARLGKFAVGPLRREESTVAGSKVVTLYPPASAADAGPLNPQDALASYTVLGRRVLLVSRSKKVTAQIPPSTAHLDGKTVLQRLIQLPASSSMANNPAFLAGVRRLKGAETAAILVQNKRNITGSSNGLPLLQRGNFDWVIAGLHIENNGLRAVMVADAPKDQDILRLRNFFGRTAGTPANLAKMLHKNALAALRVSVNLRNLFQTSIAEARRAAQRGTGQDPAAELNSFRRTVGMDLEKEVLPMFSGHAVFALLGVDPMIVSYLQRRPAMVPSLIEAAIFLELRNPSAASRLLAALPDIAAKRNLPPIQQTTGTNGNPLYKVTPSPGASLYLTIVGRTLVIALHRKALAFTLSAAQASAQRLFPSQIPPVLEQKRGVGLLLSLRNLYSAINQLNLPFSTRMVLAGFLPFLQGMELSTFRFLPAKTGFKLDISLQLSP